MFDTKSQSVSQRIEVGSDDEPVAVAIIVVLLGIFGLIESAIADTQKLMGESDIFWFLAC